ncbi:MAG: MFS transporter [Pseudomonadota bacterium]|nr:MFS transporter [Pseudomonadota bacterium]
MTADLRRLAVGLAGFCAFVNLYAPQSVLPLLARDFGTGAAGASMVITASALAVALIAPFTGAAADVLGRKRIIAAAMFALVVPTVMVALAPSLNALVFWRFVQGLLLPPIFAVTIAYVGEEWPPAQATGVVGVYMSAAGFGGFSGRFISGAVADLLDWRSAFLALAVLTLALAVSVAALLPRERQFRRSEDLRASGRQMLRHLRKPQLLATYAVGFGVLFTFIATFTYVNFHLAAPPFNLSATALGSIFVVYLLGTVMTPMTGRLVARFGRRPLVIRIIGVWIAGLLLTLVPSLPVIIAGLAISAACGFVCQAVSTSLVAVTAGEGRSSAVGLYVTSYYVGGSVGGALPGLAWNTAGWPGCVAMVTVVLILIGLIVRRYWTEAAPS